MDNLSYLLAALTVVWVGILFYMWTLRRSVQRLTEEVEVLAAEERQGGQGGQGAASGL